MQIQKGQYNCDIKHDTLENPVERIYASEVKEVKVKAIILLILKEKEDQRN